VPRGDNLLRGTARVLDDEGCFDCWFWHVSFGSVRGWEGTSSMNFIRCTA
jgi:hypothetical protein